MSEIKNEIKQNADGSFTITDSHSTADIVRWLLTQDSKETILYLLDEALAQTEQEPVATVESVATVVSESGNQEVTMSWWHEPVLPVGTKLYTTPPQHSAVARSSSATPLKPLTDAQREEIAKGWRGRNWTVGDIIDAIEAAHGIKGDA